MTQIPPPPELVPHLFELKVNDETKKQEDSVILNALVGFWYSYILLNIIKNFFLLKKNLSWCFGYNKHIGLLNLCLNDSKKLFLASSHIGVVYNFEKNEQKLLEGHVSENVTCKM